MKKFRMKTLLNHHLSLYYDPSGINFHISINKDNDDEYNWLASIAILFWSIEISWNGRKKQEQEPYKSKHSCPNCGSNSVIGWLMDDKYSCMNCDHNFDKN